MAVDWKHLRVRGENLVDGVYVPTGMETPPRTRRKRVWGVVMFDFDGNTSAYAEKTVGLGWVIFSV